MKCILLTGSALLLDLLLLALPAVMAIGGVEDQFLSERRSEEFSFTWNKNITLHGTIWLPSDGASQGSITALVHGDGPTGRINGDGYNPLINALLDRGIAVAYWDKPGVGESGGSWLDQSMSDRADETRSAIRELRERFEDFAIGAIGFSQAGWVLPRLSIEDGIDYLVLVGPAVNWQDQSDYFGTIRMEAEGKSPGEIEEALIQDRANDDVIFNAPTFPSNLGDLTEGRWGFIKRNRHEDSTIFIANLTIPTLAVWGEDDLNVDAMNDVEIYRQFLTVRPRQVVLIPEATHSLLKSTYNYQTFDQWPLEIQEEWYVEGRSAYAEGAIDLMTDWALQDHKKSKAKSAKGKKSEVKQSKKKKK
mmetsp:Transcript_35259/g.42077  ORF Transcript_35259/g.42077 Transcript_35259/m.42077 type:complete len:362 (+) Transcript_35259:45-1130(+)